jgi:hypothetical protein
MKHYSNLIIFICLFTFTGCDEISDDICDNDALFPNSSLELRSDFLEDEFKSAILGKWESVFKHIDKENVIQLKLNNQGIVCLTLEKNEVLRNYDGNYIVTFLRPPSEEMVTFAQIKIQASDTIILSRVNFGLHNAFPVDEGLFLRIDDSPYGVLSRMNMN